MDTIVMNGREARECAEESAMVLSTLKHARRIFSDLGKAMEAETDRLQFMARIEDDEEQLKTIQDICGKLQKAWQQVIDIEIKLMKAGEMQIPGRTVIDLEAARAEVARRLDRLAA